MFSFRVPLRAKGSNRVLKKSFSCFDRLSTNGKSPTIAMPAPFALSLSKGERRVFQQPVRATWGSLTYNCEERLGLRLVSFIMTSAYLIPLLEGTAKGMRREVRTNAT